MVSKLLAAIRRYDMVQPGDTVICAVSGGADSMALLWCMWLQKEKLGILVEAAHFNHQLRGEESDRDEAFVRQFCDFHDIPLSVGSARVEPGKKGLEAAAREARYDYLRSLNGLIATAHTADDNAETVLMHLIRGTGLRGLGGISPKSPGLIRPMLDVTRAEVEAFLAEHWISCVEDSSNGTDAFLRNRIRHRVMPLLLQENPSLPENLSAMAQRLRFDEQALEAASQTESAPSVEDLRDMVPALRRRALEGLLRQSGVKEPEAKHIAQAEALVLCNNPSAYARFPGGVVLRRVYGRLESGGDAAQLEPVVLPMEGTVELPRIGLRISCHPGKDTGPDGFWVVPQGKIIIRGRQPGDEMTLPGGTKSVKRIYIDKKIPQHLRCGIPVIADETGVLGVYGLGGNLARQTDGPAVTIRFKSISGIADQNRHEQKK